MQASNQFSAHDSILGYVQQLKVALLMLLRAPDGSSVSIETLDDVVVESGDLQTFLQVKHRVERRADLTDYSPDIWKTIRIWAEQLKDGQLDLSRAQLVIFTTDIAQPATVAGRLRVGQGVRDEDSARTALNEVAASATSQTTNPGRVAWLALSEDQRSALLERIVVVDGSSNVVQIDVDLRHEVRMAAEPEHLDALVDRLVAWWLRRTTVHLEQRSVDVITLAELHDALRDLREQFKQASLPIDFLEAEPADNSHDEQVFVHQLQIIGVNDTRLGQAVRDYFRASLQRDRWIREELAPPNELERYERKLVDEWTRFAAQQADELPAEAVADELRKVGRAILTWAEGASQLDVGQRWSEPYVRRGTFHILADDVKIGWHPNFQIELQQLLRLEESA